mmetsp:Transcript_5409/g.12017  ORF Transcript_5409/g.12017 Transcript_5409/m.12017 type:complete len:215 (-) Transcript_5409:1869-2513(-)
MLGADGGTVVAGVLGMLKGLELLNLSDNNLSSSGGTAIGEALMAVTTLTSLDMGPEDLDDGVWPVVSALLPRTSAITAEHGVQAFKSEEEYAAFIRSRLRPGTRLVAVSGSRKGACGVFDLSSSNNSCTVQWDTYGRSEEVNLRDVELEDGSPQRLVLVSGVGAKSTSYVTITSGYSPSIRCCDALLLAELLLRSPPPLLTSLDLRRGRVGKDG